jgi:HPt (histidine-containing phosphotransfer) domain-containing protein
MKTDMQTTQVTTPTFGVVYGGTLSTRRSGGSGVAPASSGVAPESLPIDALDPVVFGRMVALEAEAPGFLAELVTEFESGITRRLAALHEAVPADDDDAIEFAAHSIRGSCGTIGALRMAALANHLEYGSPTRSEIAVLVRQLTVEWDAVRRALDGVRP